MKNILIFFICMLIYSSLSAQNGYVKLISKSTIPGFIKQNRSIQTGDLEIKVYLTKKDKNPKSYKLNDLIEYAFKKDTFKILTNFYPFENRDLHFDYVPAKILERGKVDLLVISQLYNPTISSTLGGGLIPALIDESMGNYNGPLYVLNNEYSNLIAGVSNKLDEFEYTMNKFFKDNFSLMKKVISHEYKFRHLKKIVAEYNN